MKNRNLEHKDDWATPDYVLNPLYKEFGDLFDPCPFQHNVSDWDGLDIEWANKNFINPPYSRVLKNNFTEGELQEELVVRKFRTTTQHGAIEESKKGKLCVILLPVSTSTKLFHEHILPNKTEIRFLKGRVKFKGYNTKGEFVTSKCGMHDSMLVIFDGR